MRILLLMRNESVYNRLVSKARVDVEPFMPDIVALQTWASQTPGQAIALLDPLCSFSNEATQLLNRLHIPITIFEGNFVRAELWLMEHADSNTESDPDDLNVSPMPTFESTTPSMSTEVSVETPSDIQSAPVSAPTEVDQDAPLNPSTERSPSPPTTRRSTRSPFLNNPFLQWGQSSSERTQPIEAETETRNEALISQPVSSDARKVIPETVKPAAPVQPVIKEKIIHVEKQVEVPVYIREEVVTTLPPKIIVVVNMWPRAGASFVSSNLSYLLAQYLEPGRVTLIEHPNQVPRLWEYYSFESKSPEYADWTVTGSATNVQEEGVVIVPIHPENTAHPGRDPSSERLVQYIYRQLRKPFLVVDGGCNLEDELLLDNADHILLVMDCDPTLLVMKRTWEFYNTLSERYGDKLRLIINKWTRHTGHLEPFADAVVLPYMTPLVVQELSWKGAFAASHPDLKDDFQPMLHKLVQPWIPADYRKSTQSKRTLLPWGRRNK